MKIRIRLILPLVILAACHLSLAQESDVRSTINLLSSSIANNEGDQGLNYRYRAYAYLALAEYQNAIRDATKSISIKEDPEAYYIRGASYLGAEDYNPALKDLTKAYQLAPDSTIYLMYRGLANQYLGNTEKALADLTLAVSKKDSYLEDALSNRASLYEDLGKVEMAIEDWNRLIELNPRSSYFYNRGLVYLDNEKYDLAIKDFENSNLIESSADNFIMIGYSLGHLGKMSEANSYFMKAEKLNPSNSYLFYYWSEVLMKNGDSDAGCQKFNRAKELGYSGSLSGCE